MAGGRSPPFARRAVARVRWLGVVDKGSAHEEFRLIQRISAAQRTASLDDEQRKALLMIASGAPLPQCLDALTEAVARLAPGARACVLLANPERSAVGESYSSHLPPGFADAVRGLPIGEALIGTCGAAIHQGQPVTCEDIERSTLWAPAWRSLCLANGIRACHSHPALAQGGQAVGSFFLCLSQARAPDAWERRVAEFGALATSIVVERDRAATHQRREMQALSRLQALSAELVGPGEFEALLQKILAAAADISGTDKGNIQIYDPVRGTLRIVVHQGLGQRLVDHFREDGWDASCGAAARQVQRLIVPDVQQLEGLRGTLGLEIVAEDDIRSIQCTPLVTRDGRLLGMLNNHYRWPGGPTADALRYIDLLARQAAELIERHQTESELAEERRRKDEFLAMLAHELRNPLAPLRNMLELQKLAEGDEAVTRTARDVMERQVVQLVRLVDDLLDVNRITRGRLDLRLQPMPLQAAVQHAVEVCRPKLKEHGHRLSLDVPEAPVMLAGDLARLTQVFGNLLANAIKYTPAGGDILLRMVPLGEEVEVTVTDNGAGIPAEHIERIFDLFSQVDRTLERAQGGLGIGLMLVRQLVTLHGGTVQAFSRGLGHGSEFRVRLPSTAGALQGEPPVAQVPASSPARRVLVVDDNLDAARSLVALLNVKGHRARMALDGSQALALAEDMQPEVILMDIGMPGLNGLETCRRLREQPWGRQITIVALTGLGQASDRAESERAGFDAHLVKPVDFTTLSRVLANAP